MAAEPTIFEQDEVTAKAYDARLMRRFLGYLRPHRPIVLLSLLIVLAAMAAEVAFPWVIRHTIDGPVIQGRGDALMWATGLLLGLVAAAAFLQYVQMTVTNLAGQRIIHDIRTEIFGKLQQLPVSTFDRNPVGRLIVRVTNDVENLSELFTSGLVMFASDVLLIAGFLFVMFAIDWHMTLLTLGAAPAVIIAALLFRKHARTAYGQMRKAVARVNAWLNESVTGVRTIQMFNREETCEERFRERNAEVRDRSMQAVLLYSLFWPVVSLISGAVLVGLIIYACRAIPEGRTTTGAFIAFWFCVESLFRPIQELADKFNILQSAMASSERIFKLIDEPAVIEAPADPARPEPRGEIEFRDVSFSYDGKTPVLKNLSFHIRPGEKVALVGYTGAGKTTIVNLLFRLYDVTGGGVFVDGVDVREMDPRELRRRFGLVLQDVFLFSGTLGENLRMGADIPRDRLDAAMTVVGADRIPPRLPAGYDTPLHERGTSLSSGERQLVSFARALVFDPPVLVLDEATSSVDSETEALLQQALEKVTRGRSGLLIAHRLSTVRKADRILVLHHGKLREEGTHEELLQREGLYRKLVRLQDDSIGKA